jgi:hypothetical protein
MFHWKRKLCADGGVLRDSGGGGGGGGTPAPTQSTSYNTNVPEYAKPYVTNMLEATQKQLYKGTPTEGGGYDITGFRPYAPYSTNVNDYFAGFSPMQRQAQQATANLQLPGQYGQATEMTGLAGAGSLGLAGRMAGAGQQYAQQAQDPRAMQGYMSPYMQNVVDYQKSQALRDFQMADPMRKAQAVGQGAFGGNRMALQQAEAQRGLMSQLQGIEAQGAQQAFQNAQAQQQYAANLGLQGQQAGLQGLGQYGQMGAQLGQLGTTQLGAQQNIIAAQNQYGKEQQAAEQAKINQAIQDYATQQQYPLMQLGFMSNMLRGLPLQATTTQSYQATPSALNQGLGVLAGAAGAKQAGLFAEGGTIKGLAAGGVTGYANRGLTEANPTSGVVQGIKAKLEMMPVEQLKQVAQTSSSEEVRTMALEILREKEIRAQAEQQAQSSIAKDQQAMPTPVSQGIGLPAAPAGAMDTLNAASGGIVAFADEGQVELDQEEADRLQQEFMSRQKYADFYKKQREAAGIGAPKAGLADYYTKEQADIAEARKQKGGYNLLDFGLNFATQTGPLAYAAAKAGKATLPGMIAREDELRGRNRDVAKGLAEVEEGKRLLALGDIEGGNKMFENAQNRINKLEVASSRKATDMVTYAETYLQEKIAAGDKRDPNVIFREGMDIKKRLDAEAANRRTDVAATTATGNLKDKAVDNVTKTLEDYNSPEAKQLRKLQKEDKKNGTRTAQTYKDGLVEKEIKRVQPSSSAGSNTGGGKNTGSPALPAGFQRDKT